MGYMMWAGQRLSPEDDIATEACIGSHNRPFSHTLWAEESLAYLRMVLVFALGTCVARGQESVEKRAEVGLVVSPLS